MTDFEDKEVGWKEWLQQFQLWDPELTIDQSYLRYLKFHKITFEAVEKDKWHQYFWELLLFEPALVFGDSIGLCEEFPFAFDLVDSSPFRMKPMPLAKEQRDWVRQHMQEQVSLGIMKEVIKGQDPDPQFVTNIVLVKGGQSQTDYRVCGNFQQANTKIKAPVHPMIDCRASLDGLQGCKIISGIDIKAAFQNIWVPKELQTYLGIITQDAIYIYVRMPFGINAAPAMFQHVITIILNRPWQGVPRPQHATYLDDCGIGRPEGLDATWADTIHAIHRLTHNGLPLNIWKCQFLAFHICMLGMILWNDRFILGSKAMAKLFGAQLPKNLRELQGLMGRLNFASTFIPDYRRKIQPLLNLMSKRSDGKWTEQHTTCLNQLAQAVHSRIQLGLCDTQQPITVHMDVDAFYCSAVLTQGEGETLKVIAIMGRPLLATEQACGRIERLLIATLWALKKMGRYTQYVPQIIVVFPLPAEVSLMLKKDLPVRIQRQVVELSSFDCKFISGVGAWGLQNELAQSGIVQIKDPKMDKEYPAPELKVWEHTDIILDMPNSIPLIGQEEINGAYVVHYDGGCSKQQGTGGYIAWKPDGTCLGGQYKYYGNTKPTCNQAEAQALVDGLQWLVQKVPEVHKIKIVARGDSNLVTQFMQGRAKPGLTQLVNSVQQAKLEGRKAKGIWYQHVPREQNKWADWLTRVATYKQKHGEIIDATKVVDLPPKEMNVDFIGIGNDDVSLGQCAKCREALKDEISITKCWGCSRKYHKRCANPKGPQYPGPWHCIVCTIIHKSRGTRDVTLDKDLMRYLAVGEKPTDPTIADRVMRTSRFLSMDENGRIWTNEGASWERKNRQIPPINDRKLIIEEVAKAMAFPNGERLHALLKEQYYWSGMKTDCLILCADMLPRQKESAKFLQPPYLLPTEKGAAPFRIWCVDSIGPLQPLAPDGADHIVVAVDPFTKWVEASPIQKDSHNTASWFHREVVCRYGVPTIVRSDRGTEYSGEFDIYLKGQGIQHRRIATMNPRANGQVERMVKTIKSGIRRLVSHVEGSKWWENLPDVLRGMRCLNTRATGISPYLIVFKSEPALPIANAIVATDVENLNDEGEDIQETVKYWANLYEQIALRQKIYDSKMVEQYLRRETLAKHDVRYMFERGDPVFLRQKRPGKMEIKAQGPFIFDRYFGPLQVNAVIIAKGKEKRVSAGNILPISRKAVERMGRYMVPGIEEIEDQLKGDKARRRSNKISESIDSIEGIDSEDEGLPSGVVLVEDRHLKRLKSMQIQARGPSQFDSGNS